MTECEIPAPFLNLRVNSMVNMTLAVMCILFGICSLASSPNNYYETMGSGLWGGMIIGITGIVSYRASVGDQPFTLGCNFVLAIISMISSFTIMCICSGSLDTMHRYPDACSDYVIIPPGEYYFEETNNTIAIPPCGDYSETRQSFNALLLICSLVSIPTHSLLILGVINAFNPVSVSPN